MIRLLFFSIVSSQVNAELDCTLHDDQYSWPFLEAPFIVAIRMFDGQNSGQWDTESTLTSMAH